MALWGPWAPCVSDGPIRGKPLTKHRETGFPKKKGAIQNNYSLRNPEGTGYMVLYGVRET